MNTKDKSGQGDTMISIRRGDYCRLACGLMNKVVFNLITACWFCARGFCAEGLEFADATLPAEIPVKPPRGEWVEIEMPMTEDLASYAERAVNAATRLAVPEADWSVVQVGYLDHPGILQVQDGALLNINAKYAEALPLLRGMSGSTQNLEIDGKIIGAIVAVTGEDGFAYQPVRPWAFYDPRAKAEGKPFNDMFGEGRQLQAYAVWYMHDHNPLWKKLADRKIERMLQMAIETDDRTLYFWKGRGYHPGDTDPRQGEMHTVADVGGARSPEQGMVGAPATYMVGWTPQAAMNWYVLTHNKQGRRLAEGLAVYLQRHGRMTDDVTGEFLASHPAHVTHSLLANLCYALDADDREMIKWCRKGFDYNLRQRLDPDRTGIILSVDSDQISDMIHLGTMLSREGIWNYWEDVDRWVRSTFLPMQLREDDIQRAVARPLQQRGSLEAGHFQPEDGTERFLGAWICTLDNRGAIIGGGTANSWRALAYVWDSIMVEQEDTLTVNLLFNRISPTATLKSWLPYEGQAEFEVKRDLKQVRIRLPEWTDWNEIVCQVDGEIRPTVADKDGYIETGPIAAGQSVKLEFPIRQWTIKANLRVSNVLVESGRMDGTVTLKANTVIDIDKDVWYPLQLHASYREGQASLETKRVFISREKFFW